MLNLPGIQAHNAQKEKENVYKDNSFLTENAENYRVTLS